MRTKLVSELGRTEPVLLFLNATCPILLIIADSRNVADFLKRYFKNSHENQRPHFYKR